jgi:hypothetical protein
MFLAVGARFCPSLCFNLGTLPISPSLCFLLGLFRGARYSGHWCTSAQPDNKRKPFSALFQAWAMKQTAKLMVGTFRTSTCDPKFSRAEAQRQSMLSMIDGVKPDIDADPWIVVPMGWMSAVGTEQRSFGLSFMPGIRRAADLPWVNRMAGISANDLERS